MRILIDQDQVICKWVERVLEWFNEDKKTSYTLSDVKSWNVAVNLGPDSEDFIRSCMRYPEFYRDLDQVEGSVYSIRRLIEEMNHDVVIVTAVPRCAGIAYHGKLEWIRRNMPFFDLKNFIAAHRKDIIEGDILFDDGLHNIEAWVNRGRQAVIMDCPWNKGFDHPLAKRVSHWNEFIEFIDEYEKKGN